MDAPQYVHPYVPSTACFTECFINPSQRYVRFPVCTHWCTIRLYVLLNVLLSTPHDMYNPQCVSYIKKKESNIGILKGVKTLWNVSHKSVTQTLYQQTCVLY